MYLIDTNVWLERLLEQEKSETVKHLLDTFPAAHFAITDFSLHSIGIILTNLKKPGAYLEFIQDTLLNGDVRYVHLEPSQTESILHSMESFHLDFDDAYQYTAAKHHNLILVSFDADFERTDLGRKQPAGVL